MTAASTRFIDKWMDERHQRLAHVCMVLGIFCHLSCLTTEPIFTPVEFWSYHLYVYHLFCFVTQVGWLLFYRKTRWSLGAGALVHMVLGMIGFAWLLWMFAVHQPTRIGLMAMPSCYLALTMFGVIGVPFGGWRVPAAAVTFWVYAVVACAGDPQTWRWLLHLAVGLCIAVAVQHAFERQARRAAEAVYRTRLLLAPRALAGEADDLDDAFAAKRRRCVCVSSDWRQYQRTARGLPSDQLAAVLDRYYSEVEALLLQLVPDGRFVFDWIADELFVVLWADTEEREEKLVDLALGFARRLLLFKAEFFRQHDMPRGVDVGLAWGEATVGMMGPAGFRKASALGPAAETARRMQTAAKGLRRTRGDQDRVVFDAAVMARVNVLPDGELGQDGELHFYLPVPTTVLASAS